jgi:hypothetical protein
MKKTLLTEVESNRIDNLFSEITAQMGVSKMAKMKRGLMARRVACAPAHGTLINEGVHVFVDDQNLFWGITNDVYGRGYRVDFGRLLLEAAKGSKGHARPVMTAFIAACYPR